jgi:hypothetical protein
MIMFWATLLAVSILLYVVVYGFDLGVGIEEDGVTALRYLAADLLEVQVHRLRVGIRQDQGRTDVAMRADGAEYVGPFAALIPRRGWTASALGPDASQCALLTNPGFGRPRSSNALKAPKK